MTTQQDMWSQRNQTGKADDAAVDDFINSFQANLNGESSEEYERREKWLLENLDKFRTVPQVKDDDGYRNAMAVKSNLCSIGCYAFNNKLPKEVQADISQMEWRWGAALVKYNRRILLKDPHAKTVARYLLWSYRYSDIDTAKVFVEAATLGILRRDRDYRTGEPNNQLVVVGLEMKVGDNVFTVDNKGRHYRHYIRTVGRQAFLVNKKVPQSLLESGFVDSIPPLDDTYKNGSVSVCDGKNCARPVALTPKEKRHILAAFSHA